MDPQTTPRTAASRTRSAHLAARSSFTREATLATAGGAPSSLVSRMRTPKDHMSNQNYCDVRIIGGGPADLSTALQFARPCAGARHVECRPTLSGHPTAGGIHAPTTELLRQWGIADGICAAGIPAHRAQESAWGTPLVNGIPLGDIRSDDAAGARPGTQASPESARRTPRTVRARHVIAADVPHAGDDPAADVEVLSILARSHESAISDSWRSRRVLLSGDAARRFPPHDGFAMKQWHPGHRQPRMETHTCDAGQNVRQPARLLRTRTHAGCRPPHRAVPPQHRAAHVDRVHAGRPLPTPRDRDARRGSSTSVHRGRSAGPARTTTLARTAVRVRVRVRGHSERRDVSGTLHGRLLPADPAPRDPHTASVAERPGPGRRSTIGLCDNDLAIFDGSASADWRRAADASGLRCFVTDQAETTRGTSFEALYGAETTGAVLLRPDGHVAMRSRTLPTDPAEQSGAALAQTFRASGTP
ncbi:FAD-dependent monooxygenase [Streptomyces sp. NPDC086777]|uniref:FAD-dependent monooxygenase n=1 Tax=Streptomyces sp. NPDC086777 TaxID=3154866 RepID=UPI00344F93B4